ncbi:MAG: hypothetical protein GY765_40925 [bacterium]|nr:hypothetical protein [bacterium]
MFKKYASFFIIAFLALVLISATQFYAGAGDTATINTAVTLPYSTYLGGSDDDRGYAMTVDGDGNMYITGSTYGSNFPVTGGAYQTTFGGGSSDAFVVKLAAGGGSVVYSTYLGGSGRDIGKGIACDASGNVYVTGRTASTDFPVNNAYQSTYGGGDFDSFVCKLSASGAVLEYSTYLGGSGSDMSYGIALDDSGNMYVTGETDSTNFPTYTAHQSANGGGVDIFVSGLSSAGSSLLFSTYFGGSGDDSGRGTAVDSAGGIYITGFTDSTDFPTSEPYRETNNGGDDAFVSVFSATDGILYVSTYLGGTGNDYGRTVALDADGELYVAGYTASGDFPTAGAYQSTPGGGDDVFITKIAISNLGTIAEAVDNPYFTWTTDDSNPWRVNYIVCDAYDYDCVVGSFLVNTVGEQTGFLRTTVTGPGTLSFRWMQKDNSGNYTSYGFYLDGVLQESAPPFFDTCLWKPVSAAIPAGVHVLEWRNSASGNVGLTTYLDKVEYTPDYWLALNYERLDFAAVSGTVSHARQVYVHCMPYGAANWTVAADCDWLNISPASGTESGTITISVDASGLSPEIYSGTLTVTDTVHSTTDTIAVYLKVYGTGMNSAPFGEYATPVDGSTISSSVPFTGWVLDDIGVESVKLYCNNAGVRQYIGDAQFVEGARPDVETAHPGFPNVARAGWGYMMLTHFLPDIGGGVGNGTYEILAVALDIEGNETVLGTKTVAVDNVTAVKPFGAIDTPAQGGTASGEAYRNNGWVLTPLPNAIPTDGSTIDVYVDGVNLGHPLYNSNRPDIAGFFPDNNNSSGAGGYYDLDTTTYANGVHSIFWIAADDAGNEDGIGSRYFTIQNSGGNVAPPLIIKGAADARPDITSPLGVVVGPGNGNSADMVCPDEKGCVNVNSRELERIELHLNCPGETPFEISAGYLLTTGALLPLPIGSTLDLEEAVFYWTPGAGFVGDYRLVFFQRDEEGTMTRRLVRIHIGPRYEVKGKRKRKY